MTFQVSIFDLVQVARTFCPTLEVRFNKFFGEILIDGKVVFDTQGTASEAVLSAYISGMIQAKGI